MENWFDKQKKKLPFMKYCQDIWKQSSKSKKKKITVILEIFTFLHTIILELKRLNLYLKEKSSIDSESLKALNDYFLNI